MTFRTLTHEEWPAIEHEFSARGVELPNPETSFIEAAFDEKGKLAGFMVCQPQIHTEPLLLYDPRAARGLIRATEAEVAKRYGRIHYFAFAQDRSGLIAESLGFRKRTESIYEKKVA